MIINKIKILFDIKFIRFFIFYFFYKNKFKTLNFPNFIYSNVTIDNKKFISIGKNNTFAYNCYLSPLELVIGNNCWIGVNNVLIGKILMGSNVMIGPNVLIAGANHSYEDLNIPMNKSKLNIKGIIIEDDVWIGGNSTILDGVIIRKGSIIGAGSVVTKNVNEYSIVVGNPAKVIGNRKNED